jgi:hypothetical protein
VEIAGREHDGPSELDRRLLERRVDRPDTAAGRETGRLAARRTATDDARDAGRSRHAPRIDLRREEDPRRIDRPGPRERLFDPGDGRGVARRRQVRIRIRGAIDAEGVERREDDALPDPEHVLDERLEAGARRLGLDRHGPSAGRPGRIRIEELPEEGESLAGIGVAAVEIVVVAGRQDEGRGEALHPRESIREDGVGAGHLAAAPDIADVEHPFDPRPMIVHVADQPVEAGQVRGRVRKIADQRELEAIVEEAGPGHRPVETAEGEGESDDGRRQTNACEHERGLRDVRRRAYEVDGPPVNSDAARRPSPGEKKPGASSTVRDGGRRAGGHGGS